MRQLTAIGFHAVRRALPRCADGTAAGPSISSTARRSASSAPISLTRQRHALFGSIERGNDAARELGESKILQARGFEFHDKPSACNTVRQILPFQRPCNAGAGDIVRLSKLSEAQAAGSVAEQSWSIDLNRLAAKSATLEPGAPKSGPDPFNY